MSTQTAEPSAWYEKYATSLPPGYLEELRFESHATRMLSFGMTIIQGFLQTEDYARAILTQLGGDFLTKKEREIRLQVRMGRQQALFSREPKMQLHILIDEPVLRRQVGGVQIFVAQLHHLAELAQLSNITLQVLPLSLGIAWPLSVTLAYDIHYGTGKGQMSIENNLDHHNTSNEIEVAYYAGLFRTLCDQALDKQESLKFIQRCITEMETELMNASPSHD